MPHKHALKPVKDQPWIRSAVLPDVVREGNGPAGTAQQAEA
ncbi:MAG: hypothetical protein ACREIS_11585 [Nitrospiraceae bacterium]